MQKNQPGRINNDEPDVPTGAPDCPDWFDDIAKSEWEWLCKTMEGMGTLSPAYARSMELYCDSYSKWRSARDMVDKIGQAIIAKNSKGETEVRRNPFSVEAHKHKDECLRLLAEFGLTPSAKSRISVSDKAESASKWAQFLGGAKTG